MSIVYDLPIETYHDDRESISKTGLDLIDKCPAIFRAWQSPDAPKREPKPGQLEGHLAHCAILEPDQFKLRYAVPPKDAPRKPTEKQWNAEKPSAKSIAAMEWWSQWALDNQQKLPITFGQYEVAMCQAESVRELPEIREFLSRGRAEVSGYWTDSITGMKCRCRPDFVHPSRNNSVVLLDVKTCGDASKAEFARVAGRKRYHVQDAFYSGGYSVAANVEVEKFIFIAVESEWPYVAASYELGAESREEGFLECHRLLDIYEECLRTNVWPGYADKTTTIDLPPYVFKSQEVEISYV